MDSAYLTEHALYDVIKYGAAQMKTPAFRPHMTLLAGVTGMMEEKVIERTKKVAKVLDKLQLEVKSVTSKELLYFQCVFALLHLTDELTEAYKFAEQVFERQHQPDFMPHISLVYGDLSTEQRYIMSQDLGPRVDGMKMTMEKLQLWNTTGPVDKWELVTEYLLK